MPNSTEGMYLTVIGDGNVSWHFVRIFQSSGFKGQIIKRNIAGTEPKIKGWKFTTFENLNPSTQFILIAVSDTNISEVVENLKSKVDSRIMVAHTAGSVSSNWMQSFFPNSGVMYPLQSLSKGVKISAKKIPIYLTGNSDTINEMENICKQCNFQSSIINDEQRLYLHIGAVMTNNFSNYLMILVEKFLKDKNLPLNSMFPLLEETIHKLKLIGPEKSQTGPAKRNDQNVMNNHLELLKENNEALEVYKLFSTLLKKHYS
jgi:hypothetical protein